jgi:hypothetical protein
MPTLKNAGSKGFVFSEWAASNKQTFVFEGSYLGVGAGRLPRHQPCKFVPTKMLTLAVQDAEFVAQVRFHTCLSNRKFFYKTSPSCADSCAQTGLRVEGIGIVSARALQV